MATPSSRQELIDYCLRTLGEPVIEINVDPDQAHDRLDEALQYYQEFHSDSTKKMFVPHLVTEQNINDKYIDLPSNIIFLERVLPIADSSGMNMFDVKYQLHLNDVFQLGNLGNLSYYEMVQQQLSLYDLKIGSGNSDLVRWVRHENRLYLDIDKEEIVEGTYIILSCRVLVEDTNIYNDMFLKRYTTALIKKQWGANLIKFEGMVLPGGVTLNGRQLFDDAVQEIQQLEEEMRLTFELPVDFYVG
jgi:hypothetical protein